MTVKTLGNYRDLMAVIAGQDSPPVKFLDKKIAEQGRNELVIADDTQMMIMLASMMERDDKHI